MLNVTETWWPALMIAAGCGMIGGFISELISNRPGTSPLLEIVRQAEKARDWFQFAIVALSPLLVGAVAAVAFLYFLPPEQHTVLVNKVPTDLREYDPYRLIAASLILGTAGTSFVKSMQEKLLKAAGEGQTELLTRTTQAVVKNTKESLAAETGDSAPADSGADAGADAGAGAIPAQPTAESFDGDGTEALKIRLSQAPPSTTTPSTTSRSEADAHAIRHSHAIGQLDALATMAEMLQSGTTTPPAK